MALSDAQVFVGDGSTRDFTILGEIPSESHLRVWIDDVIQSADDWDLLGNTVLFDTAPLDGVNVQFLVSTTGSDFPQSPSDVSSVALNINDVVAVSEGLTEVGIVSDNIAEVIAVSASIADVIAVNTEPLKQSILDAEANATNAEQAWNDFQSRYYGSFASDPLVDPLGNTPSDGDLYFNTVTDKTRIYNGSIWGDFGSAVNGFASNDEAIATEGQTLFNGLTYDIGFIMVYRNGYKLPTSDYTANDGTTLTLVNPASEGDDILIISFGSFSASGLDTIINDVATNASNIATNVSDILTLSGRTDTLEQYTIDNDTAVSSIASGLASTDASLSVVVSDTATNASGLDALTERVVSLESLAHNIGFADYNDLATQTVPINVTGGAGYVDLPNDGLGAFTIKSFLPVGVTDVWDASTERFDFTELSLGDMIDIRLDIEVTTTSPSQVVDIVLELGTTTFPFNVPFVSNTYKSAGVHTVNRYNGFYIGSANTRDGGGRFRISSDDDCTVKVNGWYAKLTVGV